MSELALDWYDRYGEHSEDDTYRAETAAREVLSAAGITNYREAFEAYAAAINAGAELSGIALVWADAEIAACRAATAGWYDPHEAGVFLSA